jgi:hypothetical protein
MQYEENKDPSSFSPCGRRCLREAKADEGSLSAETNPSSVADFVRATFSHKGRREEKRPRSKPGPDVADR